MSLLLGLPTALVAHALVFGNGHVVGGALHVAILFASALFAVGGAAVGIFGTVRGTSRWSPRLAALAVGAGAWLAGIELTEAPHAVPVLLCAVALAIAALLVTVLLRAFTTAVVALVCAFSQRLPRDARVYLALPECARIHRRDAWAFTLFSRPPPRLS